MQINFFFFTAVFFVTGMVSCTEPAQVEKPNIVLIYADDLGYGDVSAYGAEEIQTPNIDRLAREGLLFTNAHATSATCTPSRYGLLTGQYPWRRQGTGIAPWRCVDDHTCRNADSAICFENSGL